MRICHFTATGVGHPYFRNITRGLTARGHQVLLGTLGNYAEPGWLADCAAATYFSVGGNTRAAYPWAIARLSMKLRHGHVDVCHAHLFDGGVVGISAARLARVPVVVLGRHHLDQHQLLRRPIHTRIDRAMSSHADCTVVPSQALLEHMRAVEGLSGARIEVIRLGFDFDSLGRATARARAVRQELGLQSAFILGYTGRLVTEKGIETLLTAARALTNEIPELRLLLVGAPIDERIESAIAGDGLAERVVTVGWKEDPAAYMAAMDVAVHPSYTDTLPQAVIEAMGVGTPVVATRVGGIPEIITDEESGLLVAPHSSDELAAAIARCHREPGLRSRLAMEGQRAARARFGLDRMVSEHLATYESLLTA